MLTFLGAEKIVHKGFDDIVELSDDEFESEIPSTNRSLIEFQQRKITPPPLKIQGTLPKISSGEKINESPEEFRADYKPQRDDYPFELDIKKKLVILDQFDHYINLEVKLKNISSHDIKNVSICKEVKG